jgi:aminopeptidase N
MQDDMLSVIPDCDPVKLYENVTRKIYYMIADKSMDYLESTAFMIMSKRDKLYDLSDEQVVTREYLRTLMKLRLSHYDEKTLYFVEKAHEYFINSKNFTDISYCIGVLSGASDPENKIYPILKQMINKLGEDFKGDSLMTSKWLRFISKISSPKTINDLYDIYSGTYPIAGLFNKKTPNHIYALVYAFTTNPYFHHIDKELNKAYGYNFITDCILDIDTYNPTVASRIAGSFEVVKSLSPEHQKYIKQCIARILASEKLSSATREIMSSF